MQNRLILDDFHPQIVDFFNPIADFAAGRHFFCR